MKIKSLAPLYVLVLSLTLQACGGSGAGIIPEPSVPDTGTTDGGTTDGTTDGGATDGTSDGGQLLMVVQPMVELQTAELLMVVQLTAALPNLLQLK